MPIVVDTSTTLAWLLPDEHSILADRVLQEIAASDDTIIVPPLWVAETADVIVAAVRRGRLTEAQSQRCLELLAALPVQIDAPAFDQGAIVAAALRHDLSADDATYLLLAERRGVALATLDRRLAHAAGEAGITVLPHLPPRA